MFPEVLEYRVSQLPDLTNMAYAHFNMDDLSRYVTSTFAYRPKFHQISYQNCSIRSNTGLANPTIGTFIRHVAYFTL